MREEDVQYEDPDIMGPESEIVEVVVDPTPYARADVEFIAVDSDWD
jgi:hypothetical protein